jgi:hypothetical protein
MKPKRRRPKFRCVEHDSERELLSGEIDAPKTRIVNGLVVFDLPSDSNPVTSEDVKKLQSEER